VRSLSSGKTKSDFDPRGPSALVSRAVLGIDHHPHDATGYIGRLINSAAWVALSAGHADTAAIGRVGPLARAAPRPARMLLAHPAGIKADQRVERSLYQRAVGYTFERPIRRSSENQTNGRSATSV